MEAGKPACGFHSHVCINRMVCASHFAHVSYMMGDVRSLVEAHEKIDLDNVGEHEEGSAKEVGEYIKAFVFGGLDGIVSTFALVASMDGARISAGPMLAVGLAKVISDAFSMGFGEFTSATAELEHSMAILKRETWETENHLEGEVKEMCEIYMQRGASKQDALTMMTVLSKYKDLFIENMLIMEHGILPPDMDDKWQPLKQGFVCFFAFAIFGLIPLAAFIVLFAVQGDVVPESSQTLLVALCMTAATLFTMGFIKAKLTSQPKQVKSGLLMVLNGSVAGGVAYLIGEMLVALIES